MKTKCYDMSKKKHKLQAKLVKPGDYVTWVITKKSEIEIYKGWGYQVIPISYKVYSNTAAYKHRKNSKIVQDVYFKSIKSKKRTKEFIMELKPEQVNELRRYNFKVEEYRYKICKPHVRH